MTRRALRSLLALLALQVLPAGVALARPASPAADAPTESADLAVVVLIGNAGESFELRSVISELLLRQDVQPQLQTDARFEPGAWLDASAADARAWVFVSLQSAQLARLYFRGPHGERFLQRDLLLRDGLDEVGRELIARVIETSTVALLRSSEGISLEEARANLAREAQDQAAQPAPPPPAAEPKPVPEPVAAPSSERHAAVEAMLGVRLLGHWTGSDLGARAAAGLEGGVAFHHAAWIVRARMSGEIALPQTLDTPQVQAKVVSVPLRIGIDLGIATGAHAWLFSLSTGADIVQLSPEHTRAPSLELTDTDTSLLPSSRVELRYELGLGADYFLALSALAELRWKSTHYDVIEAGAHSRVAQPWRIQPGLALGLGARL